MALSSATLRTAVRETVEGAEPRSRPYATALTNSPSTGGTTFSVGDGDAWQVGDLAETPDGEICLVTAISTNDLTVTRSYGSIAAEDLASGDILRKNPRFSIAQIDQAIEDILLEIAPRVYYIQNENVAYTVDDWYDVTDTTMEEVFSAWYIDDGDFCFPLFYFRTDPANAQPKVFLAAAGYTGNIHLNYRAPYAAVTEMPDRLRPMMVAGATYKLLGGATITATNDAGKRTDRTVQAGQESRDSYWFYREYLRLRDAEVAYQADQVARLPKDRVSQRAKRFRK